MRITDDQWVDIPEQTASTGAYSLSGGGLDQIATMGPTQGPQQGPVWDQAENAYYDMGASGLYSYDGGNSWEPKRAAPIPQSYSLNSPQLDQIATTYAGPTWVDNGTAGGKYVDQWGNESYDGGNTWMSPGEIQAGAGQPAFAPQSWNEPQPIPDTYSLGFNGTAFNGYGDPGAQNPWDTRFDQQPDQGGGFWGGVKDIAGNVNDFLAPGYTPIAQVAGGYYNAANSAFDSLTGTTREQRINDQLSGNALVRDVSGGNVDLSQLPYGLGYVTDAALAPATYVGMGATGGPGATAWEGVKQVGSGAVGNLAAKFGASDTAESIPLFGDQPAWLRGLEAGAIGGIGAYGAMDAAPGVAKAAGPILKDFNASEAGEAFGTGIRRNVPEKTVIPDSSRVGIDSGNLRLGAADQSGAFPVYDSNGNFRFNVVQYGGGWASPADLGKVYPTPEAAMEGVLASGSKIATGTPAPMANDRLWFHSTRDMNYDLPDPDMAVGTQTGITQGPGVYMAADPAKSAGNYGNRTFVTEFDGKVLDLTKPTSFDAPIAPGAPTWAKLYDDVARNLEQNGLPDAAARVRAITPEVVARAKPNAEVATPMSGYAFKQALVDAIGGSRDADALWGWSQRLEDGAVGGKSAKDILGRFADVTGRSDNPKVVAGAYVQNQLADHGVDALFHHSPRADGDVLIVLNGKAARVVADVKNAPDAVKAGATLRDIKRGALTKVLGTDLKTEAGPGEWFTVRKGGAMEGFVRPTDGGWEASLAPNGGRLGTFPTRAEAIRQFGASKPSLRSFLKGGEEGAVNLGDFAQGAKDVAGFAAPIAARTALGAGVGAAYGEASGMGWEKGAAIGGGVGLGFGVLGKAAGAAASRGVEARLAKNTRPEATDKIIEALKKAVPIREDQEALYSAERGRRAAIASGIVSKSGDFRTGMRESTSALAGQLPRARAFEGVEGQLAPTDVKALFDHIETKFPNADRYYTAKNATEALEKVMLGELPTRSEISLLGKVFGEDFAQTLLSKRSLGAKAWENAVDALNLPRTLMTSWDASAPLRQGAILFAGHPIAGVKATGTMIRAMASPKYAELVRQQIENSPNATIYEKMGLYFADTTSSAALTAREEQIMSRLAGKIPGVGGSQRGYTTFLNKLRQDVADNFIAGHPNLSNKELKDFGHVINIMSGRGDLPKFLQDNSAILNAAFAPRYAMSRLQLPVEMVKAALPRALGGTTGAASKELARDVIAFAGTGAAILTLGKLAGVWNVELDPRSTDFGKGKMGNTRFDFWAGEQQIARYAAQLVGDPTRGVDSLKTGQRKTSTGQIVDANRLDTIGRWLQTKKSPAVGLATDLLQGKDFVGQPLDLKTKEGIGNQAWQRLAPLFLQDMADAAKLSGNQWRALSAGPSAIGAGVQTYQDSDYKKRSDLSKQTFGKDYFDLTVKQQQQVDDAMGGRLSPANPQVAAALQKVTTAQQGADSELATGAFTPSKAQAWRDQYTTNKDNLRFFKDIVYADAGTKPGSDPVLDAYYKAVDGASAQSGKVNWDAVDAYTRSLSTEDQQYIKDHTGKIQIDTPTTRAFEQAKDTIESAGFFDKRDKAWAAIQAQLPEAKKYASYDEWYNAKLEAAQKEWAGQATPEYIDKEARKIIDKMAPAKGMKEYGNLWENGWIQANPAAAYLAWKWGYFVPTEEQAKWINNAVGAK